MKSILYLAYVRLPTEKAHGVQIMKTCEAFANVGANVELVIPGRKTPITDDAFNYYGVETNFSITNLKTPDFITWGPLGFVLGALWFSEVAKLRKSFWKADIIYSRDASVLLQYILLRKKFVYEAHTKPTFISKIVAQRASHLVVISNGLRDAYKKIGVKGEIIVAHDAIDSSMFQGKFNKTKSRKWLGIPEEEKVAMYVGRVDSKKGVDTFAAASEFVDSVQFVVIGSGPELTDLKRKYPKTLFLHETLYKDLPKVLSAADVLVVPNSAKDINSSTYSSPLKLFAYMAMGKPMVASHLPSLREVLNESDVFFFKADNVESLTETIQHVFSNPIEAHNRSQEALKKVQRYTWENRALHILKPFEK